MISRNPHHAAEQRYDVIIVGGGVHGICATLEAARRGLYPLLIESRDFGHATSANTLRIVHGGLRYLQSLDLPRHRASVDEQRFFARHLPELVEPVTCVMPLHQRGLKRSGVMRVALKAHDLLAMRRGGRLLTPSRVVDACRTQRLFPDVRRDGLAGAAVWHELALTSPARVLIELLHWACACGATALNQMHVTALHCRDGRVTGLQAVDQTDETAYRFRAPVVLNCAGPALAELAARLDRPRRGLFAPALAFNLLLDVPPPAAHALAVQPPQPHAPVYFLMPLRGRLLAGTYHAPVEAPMASGAPTPAHIEAMLGELNAAVPSLALRPDHVARVCAGLIPARRAGTSQAATKPRVLDHARHGGPAGLLSVRGVKFTTARRVAEQALQKAWRGRGGLPRYRPHTDRPQRRPPVDLIHTRQLFAGPDVPLARALQELIAHEAVLCLDDLVRRRTDWLASEPDEATLAARLRQLGVAGAMQARA